jgi:hypothetical protein
MALEERTRNYEVLIRLNADGTSGAHLQTITEALRDGGIAYANVNEPQPLTLEELKALIAELAE